MNGLTIRDIAASNDMTLADISARFGIPLRTVESWSAPGKNHREPPEYLLRMIDELLTNDRSKGE